METEPTLRRLLEGETGTGTMWHYTAQEWRQFTRWAWRRTRRDVLRLVGFVEGILLVIFLIVLLIILASPGSGHRPGEWALPGLIFLVIGLVVGLIPSIPALITLLRWSRPGKSFAYFGSDLIILGGKEWTMLGLHWAGYDPGPPAMLGFGILTRQFGTGTRYLPDKVRVPVPPGHEAEAKQLADDLMAELARLLGHSEQRESDAEEKPL